MRRIVKLAESAVVEQKLTYKKGSNAKLRTLLAQEQHNLCAYTETYLRNNGSKRHRSEIRFGNTQS